MNKIKDKFYCEFCILMTTFFMILISGVCNRIEWSVLLSILIYVICCIIIPGGGIFRLLPIRNTTFPEKILFIIAYGYIWTMILYVLLKCLKLNQYLQIVFAIQAVAFICVIWIKKEVEEQDCYKKDMSWLGWVFAIFTLSLIVFSVRNSVPTFIDKNTWHNDMLFWIGDIIAIKHKIPPLNFRTLNEGYHYHYLGTLQLASISETTNISATLVAIVYSHVQSSIMLGLSAYCLFTRIITKRKTAAFALFLLFFSTGYERFVTVTWFCHIIWHFVLN